MNELRDKVARAMVERQHMEWDQLDGGEHGYYGQLADSAIATVQEATADTITTLRAEISKSNMKLITAHSEYQDLSEQLSTLRAEVAALREGWNDVLVLLEDAPELNPSNYDHDQVCLLNSQMVQAWELASSIHSVEVQQALDAAALRSRGL